MKYFLFLVLALGVFPCGLVLAQGINFSSTNSDPIEVTASDGIELHQKENKVVARKDALAKRSGSTLSSDVIEAFYRTKESSGNEIYRLKASGNVVMRYGTETARGNEAEYSVDIMMLALKGEPAVFITGADKVTANVLEYWQKQELVIAKGNALLTRDGRTVSADQISALFTKDKKGSLTVEKMQADGNVVIKTENEQATGERATYNPKTGIAILLGNVKLTQKDNYMTGAKAVVNLTTGISKLYANLNDGSGSKRVKGVFLPKSVKKDTVSDVKGDVKPETAAQSAPAADNKEKQENQKTETNTETKTETEIKKKD